MNKRQSENLKIFNDIYVDIFSSLEKELPRRTIQIRDQRLFFREQVCFSAEINQSIMARDAPPSFRKRLRVSEPDLTIVVVDDE